MKIETAFVGARLVDSYPYSLGGNEKQARALKERGVDGIIGYLGCMNAARLGYVLDAGLAFMPVTLAGEVFDGAADELAQLRALGIPEGATVWLDVEGPKMYGVEWSLLPVAKRDQIAAKLIVDINAWAKTIAGAGYIAGLYIAPPQPLSGPELAKLAVTRYWNSAGRVWDRNGKVWDEPEGVGFCMRQGYPQGNFEGTDVFVDPDMVWQDRKGRLPTWVVRE